MARKKDMDPASAARGRATESATQYLSRIPESRFPREFNDLRKRLSSLGEGADESHYFPAASSTGDGIYVQGPQVIFKNVIDMSGKSKSYDFFVDEVSIIYHHATFFFLFLILGWSAEWANYVVLFDKDYNVLAAVKPQASVRGFILHLMAVNPNIVADEYILRYATTGGGLGLRMFGKFCLAILGNLILYALVLLVIRLFF